MGWWALRLWEVHDRRCRVLLVVGPLGRAIDQVHPMVGGSTSKGSLGLLDTHAVAPGLITIDGAVCSSCFCCRRNIGIVGDVVAAGKCYSCIRSFA